MTEAFLEAISHAVLDNASFTVVQLHENDFADGAWMLRLKNGDSFLIFVDTKSAKIADTLKQPPAPLAQPYNTADLPGGGKQAARLMSIAAEAETIRNVQNGSIAEALKEGRFLFVYVSTGMTETFGVGDRILHLGGEHAELFLSFFAEFYSLNRQ